MTTRTAGGMWGPYKGPLPAAPKGAHMAYHTATVSLATPKGVLQLLDTDFVDYPIRILLLTDVLPDGRLIQTYRAHVVALGPEMAVPKLVPQVGKPIEDHQRTLAFQVPHDARDRVLRWDLDQHMNVITAGIGLDNLDPFVLT